MLCRSTQNEGGLCTASDAAGATELPLRLEYGDFGESPRLLVPLSPRLLATLSPCLHLNIFLSGEADLPHVIFYTKFDYAVQLLI